MLATVLLAMLGAPVFAWPAVGAASVPYNDYAVTGSVGLCDPAGRPVTHGNVNDKPFVSRAVSSTPAVAPFDGRGRKATLLAYQPRPGANPNQWSGDTLTSSSSYTNPRHPMAQATVLDFRLKDFLREFAPMWHGLIQLRIYLGAPGQGTFSDSYPATDIRVTGDTWAVVHGANVVCTDGSATASEIVPPTVKKPGTTSPSRAPKLGHPSTPRPASSPRTSDSATDRAPDATDAAAQAAASRDAKGSRSGTPVLQALGAVAVALAGVALAGIAFWWRRRRMS